MKRRTFFGVAVALLASVPALAQSLKMPKREPLGLKAELDKHQRFLFININRFDGWNGKREQFRIVANRFPVGNSSDESTWKWEHTIPYRLLHEADYVAVVGGPVLKDRFNPLCNEVLSTEYMMSAPLLTNDDLIAKGWRLYNESYATI